MQANRTQLADMFGVTVITIDSWVRDGMPFLQRADRKQCQQWAFDTPACIKWYVKRQMGEYTGPSVGTYEEARTRELQAKAELKELQVAVKRKELINVDDALLVVQEAYSVVKSQLRAIPARVAQAVAIESNPKACEELLKAEVHEVLETLSAESLDVVPESPNGD